MQELMNFVDWLMRVGLPGAAIVAVIVLWRRDTTRCAKCEWAKLVQDLFRETIKEGMNKR